jgi:rubrerythrin
MTELDMDAVLRAKRILDAQDVPLKNAIWWCSHCGKTTPQSELPCCRGMAETFRLPLPC